MIINNIMKSEEYILYKITLLKNGSKMTTSQLARSIDISITNPYFYKILKYLLEEKAIIIEEKIGNCNILRINTKIVDKIFAKTEIYQKIRDWIHIKLSTAITPF